MPTRVGRTSFVYDAAGRVVRTVTKRISKKPLVRSFYYATGAQPIGFDSSDQPGVGYRYVYDGLKRRVAKETIDTATGNVTERVVFAHAGNQLVAEHTTVGADRGRGFVWTTDPETGEILGQITLTPRTSSAAGKHRSGNYPNGDARRADVSSWSQDEVDAEFFAIVTDLAGAPHEIIHPDTGDIVGTASQTLYGQRTWRGEQSSPLLFAGQYADDESGWAYNRFRYYNPHAGVYNAQDPLGATPRLASAQGYVDHAAFWVDVYGLKACSRILAKNMEKAKREVPENYAAHHIVAGNAKRAEPARKILKKLGIDINHANNGVGLPRNVEHQDLPKMTHSKLHTNDYYDYVNAALEDVTTKDEAFEILEGIRGHLLKGVESWDQLMEETTDLFTTHARR